MSTHSQQYKRILLGVTMALVVFIPTLGMANVANAATNTSASNASSMRFAAETATSKVAAATAIAHKATGNDPSGNTASTHNVALSTAGDVSGVSSDGKSIGMKLPNKAKNMQNVNGSWVADPTDTSVAVVTPKPGGYQVSQQMSGPDAPTSFSYKMSLPTGYKPVEDANGLGGTSIALTSAKGVTPIDATNTIGFIEPAWAYDANGNSVPTSYSVKGNTVTQTVDTSAVTAWPVVADPSVTFGWVIYLHWSHSEVGNVLLNAFFAGVGAASAVACTAGSLGVLTAPCMALFGFVFGAVIAMFNMAYSRGGGLVWEFTYALGYCGYMYVGNNWS